MKINNKIVTAKEFAYDGCHKMYLLENMQDKTQARNGGYKILPIEQLPDIWEQSCELRFIRNWNLDKVYVKQFGKAVFEL